MKVVGTFTIDKPLKRTNRSRYETACNYDIDILQPGDHDIVMYPGDDKLYFRIKCKTVYSYVVSRLFQFSKAEEKRTNRDDIHTLRFYWYEVRDKIAAGSRNIHMFDNSWIPEWGK